MADGQALLMLTIDLEGRKLLEEVTLKLCISIHSLRRKASALKTVKPVSACLEHRFLSQKISSGDCTVYEC